MWYNLRVQLLGNKLQQLFNYIMVHKIHLAKKFGGNANEILEKIHKSR